MSALGQWQRESATAKGRDDECDDLQRQACEEASDADFAHEVGKPLEGSPEPLNIPHWPAAPGPAAFHGLAGKVVRTLSPHSEADPAAILVQFLVAAGNLIGRSPYTGVEGDAHHMNINALVVGPTASGRKGTAWGQCRTVLTAAEPSYVTGKDRNVKSGLSSGEGLVYHVRDESQRPARRTGDGASVTDAGVQDKRLLVVETEFGGPLRQMAKDGNTLSPRIREAFDTGDLSTLTRGEPLTATGAHVSIIGHITPEELRRRLSDEEVANGFANRFLYVMARRSQYLPDGGEPDPAAVRSLAADLAAVRAAYRHRLVLICRDPEAQAAWKQHYPELSDGAPGLLGSLTSRGTALVLRLALVYAALDRASRIAPAHLEAALAVWDYSVRSAAYVFGQQLGDPVAARIMAALEERGSLTGSEISALFDRHKPAAALKATLEHLQSAGRIECVQVPTRGRSVEKWTAKKAK